MLQKTYRVWLQSSPHRYEPVRFCRRKQFLKTCAAKAGNYPRIAFPFKGSQGRMQEWTMVDFRMHSKATFAKKDLDALVERLEKF
jgi:hypothetical protein